MQSSRVEDESKGGIKRGFDYKKPKRGSLYIPVQQLELFLFGFA